MRNINWRTKVVSDAKKDILQEKSLWDAYKKIRVIPNHSNFNAILTLICVLFVGVFAYFDPSNPMDLAERLGKLASDGISFATTILGFLVAGFTVFATITKPELFTFMAIRTHKESNLSFLKYNFFRFLNVFIAYLVFAGVCLGLRVLYDDKGGNIVFWLASFSPAPDEVAKNVTKIFNVLLLGLFIEVLLLLKSFVFNVYHVVMTAIRWELENKSLERKRPLIWKPSERRSNADLGSGGSNE